MVKTIIEIASKEHLLSVLAAARVDVSTWGQGEAKGTVDGLFKQVATGNQEYFLADVDGRLCRCARVVKAHLTDPHLGRLKEVRHIRPNGSVFEMSVVREPGGKAHRGEALHDALIREVKEELGLFHFLGDYTFEYEREALNDGPAKEYPGLWNRYEISVFRITLTPSGLPRIGSKGHAWLDPTSGEIIHCVWVKS